MPQKPKYSNDPTRSQMNVPKPVKKARPSMAARGYGLGWAKISRNFLRTFPMCISCGGKASSVDHIIPVRAGGTHDEWNLQPLCQSCHNSKTNADKKRRF